MKKLAALIVVGLLWASCASAAVAFDANATADCTSNAVATKDCATLTVGAGANRALVCQLVFSNKGITGLAVTWDNGGTNQAMTLINTASSTGANGRPELWGLVNPTSGAKTLHTAWTGSSDITINCVSWTGVDQTGSTTTFPHSTTATGTTGAGTATHATTTITSAVGNATMTSAFSVGSFNSTNQTQTYIDNTPANISGAGDRAAGAATVTHNWNVTSAGSDTWAIVGTDILASGGAAACTPTLMLLGVGRCG